MDSKEELSQITNDDESDEVCLVVSLEERRAQSLSLIIATSAISVGSLLCVILPFLAAMKGVTFVISHEILIGFLPPLGWILWHYFKHRKESKE